mmetsp:Transcript_16680/g.25527  ORF Transcript_16680/g.25527 Transcript_16680/m.25527 type:complete len:177 (+) Transcript_16680:427-957(+)
MVMVQARSISSTFRLISKTSAIEATLLSILWITETLFLFTASMLVSIGGFSTVTRFVILRMLEFKVKRVCLNGLKILRSWKKTTSTSHWFLSVMVPTRANACNLPRHDNNNIFSSTTVCNQSMNECKIGKQQEQYEKFSPSKEQGKFDIEFSHKINILTILCYSSREREREKEQGD